jgi:hypothetical protein
MWRRSRQSTKAPSTRVFNLRRRASESGGELCVITIVTSCVRGIDPEDRTRETSASIAPGGVGRLMLTMLRAASIALAFHSSGNLGK